MATVYRRGNTWYAQWYRADGKRAPAKSTGTDKKREAQRIAAEFETKDRKEQEVGPAIATKFTEILGRAAAEASAGKLTPHKAEEYLLEIRQTADPDFKRITLAEHLTAWVADQQKRVSDSTDGGYRNMRDTVKKTLGKKADQPLQEFTHTQALKLLHDLKEGRTAATANLMFRSFRRALHQAVRAKHITDNPAVGVPPLPEDDSVEREPFSAQEVAILIENAPSEEWKGCILIGAHTGLRIGDIVKLTPKHIEDGQIVIRPAKTKRQRKTVRIPLSQPVMDWMAGKEQFFPTLSTAKKGTLSTWFARLMDSVKEQVPKKGKNGGTRSFHSLRHSFTSWLADADIQADVRQKLTGHSSAGIHAGYTHHDKALLDAISKLPELIPDQSTKE